MKSKKARALVITLSVVVFLVIASTAAFQIFFRLPQPSYSGTIDIDGLKSPVEVRTDDYGVPHILAQNEDDLFFAQGYITARERMFQMDLTRLAGRGELSTLLGDRALKADKYYRTLGFYRAAESEYSDLPPQEKSVIDAYSRGVNAYINTVKFLPIEYTVLGGKPQLWKPQDCVAIGILMAYNNTAARMIKPFLYQVGTDVGFDKLKYIAPCIPDDAPTVSVNNDAETSIANCELSSMFTAESRAKIDEDPLAFSPVESRASNWMIFSGSRTTTGKPIFSGSPDLEPAIPAIFYLVHLKCGAYDVIGGSVAGAPGVNILGCNGRIIWSITNGSGDNLDYFVEKLNPDNPNQYLTEDGYKDFDIVDETIKIKAGNGVKEEKLQVKISSHGPIISDVIKRLPQNCAVQWVGFRGHVGVIEAFLALNKAQNFSEFRQALSIMHGSSWNFGYADVEGNIGYQFVTTFPVRKSGDNPIPRPGETTAYDWTGYVPFEDHAHDYNPAKGYLGSFNQMPARANFYGTSYYEFERACRFNDIVKSKDKFSIEDVKKMQLDTVDYSAIRWVPHIIQVCTGVEELKPYISLFDKWNCSIDLDSPAATLYNTFYTRLVRNTLEDDIGQKSMDDIYKEEFSGLQKIVSIQITKIMDDNDNILWDDTRTTNVRETRDDIVLKSVKEAVKEVTGKYGNDPRNWEWGKVHAISINHPLGSVLPFLNLSPIPFPGDDLTINAGWWDREHPYAMLSGSCIRIVADMSDLNNMTLISPAGQSGLYLSPYYNDEAKIWATGKQIPANYLSSKELKHVLLLQPVQTK